MRFQNLINIAQSWLNDPRIKFRFPWILLGISLCIVIFGAKDNSIIDTLSWMVKNGSLFVILALGVSLVIATGGIDLSITGLATFTGLIAAIIIRETHSYLLAIIICIAIGITSGLILGYSVAKRSSPPLIFSWALGIIWYSLGLIVTRQYNISIRALNSTGIAINETTFLKEGTWWIVMLLFFIVGILDYSGIREKCCAVGGNKEAAMFIGIKPIRVVISAYVICGIFAGLAGFYSLLYLDSAQTNGLMGKEINAIAIAVIGGTALSGGYLNFYSVIVAAFFFNNLNKCTNFIEKSDVGVLNTQDIINLIFSGTFLLIAIFFGKKLSGETTTIQIDKQIIN